MNAVETVATFSHENAYETFLSFIFKIDAIYSERRISGKFISSSDRTAIFELSNVLWRVYSNKRDELNNSGMRWDEACDYASAYILSQYANAQYNVDNQD